MNKTVRILKIIALIILILLIGLIVFIVSILGDKYIPENDENINTPPVIVKENPKIDENVFLINPINLIEFKKGKKVTTGVSKAQSYWIKPRESNDYLYYSYNFPLENLSKENYRRINFITVLKKGEFKHTYDDETEELVQMNIFQKDPDLKEFNLIGKSQNEIENLFNNNYVSIDTDKIYYQYKNIFLLLFINNQKVEKFIYIKSNSDTLPKKLKYSNL